MNVDIYLRERSGKREIRIPLLPEKILVQHRTHRLLLLRYQ